MKIILIQDVSNLGKKGDIKEVAEGYARNFLLPRKLAQLATEQTVKDAEIRRKKEAAEQEKTLENMRKLAAVWKGRAIVLKSNEKKGKLFGSISAKDIAQALEKEGLNIKYDKIVLENPIKNTGNYEVEIMLAPGASTKIKLEVLGT